MKAAVLKELGTTPVFTDFDDPVPENDEQQIIHVKAAPLKYLDKLKTQESFYAHYKNLPVVAGTDGVGILQDGTRVYAQGISGMFAEEAVISTKSYAILPEHLDLVTAAALPNAVQGSVLPMRVLGNIQNGDTVFVNGGTGFVGQLAVQAAKQYGAAHVIATGRDEERLEELMTLGTDNTISLAQSEENIRKQTKRILGQTPIDIVIDYLWGHPAELLIDTLANGPTHPVRFINVGHIAGPTISLSAGTIRNSKIEVLGAGLGSYTKEEFSRLITEFVPEMYQLAAQGKLSVNTEEEPLENIEAVWNRGIESGKRLVLTI